MSNEYENCKRFKEVTLAKQRERDGYTVEGKDARYWHAKYLDAQEGYLNMRAFANANGLDTATAGGSNAAMSDCAGGKLKS